MAREHVVFRPESVMFVVNFDGAHVEMCQNSLDKCQLQSVECRKYVQFRCTLMVVYYGSSITGQNHTSVYKSVYVL